MRRTRDIAYGPAGRHNQLDLYRHRSAASGCPTLVYFHPGGFVSGRKSRDARPIFDQLVRHGWVCVSANYRLGRAGSFPGNLVDAKRVIAWLRDHADEYGADPDTVIVTGGSAGAHLAAMCALTANDPRFQPGFEDADTTVGAAIGLYGYYGPAPTGDPIPSSPEDYVRTDAPPFLLIHGARDPMVPARDVRRFVERLRSASSSPVVSAELPGDSTTSTASRRSAARRSPTASSPLPTGCARRERHKCEACPMMVMVLLTGSSLNPTTHGHCSVSWWSRRTVQSENPACARACCTSASRLGSGPQSFAASRPFCTAAKSSGRTPPVIVAVPFTGSTSGVCAQGVCSPKPPLVMVQAEYPWASSTRRVISVASRSDGHPFSGKWESRSDSIAEKRWTASKYPGGSGCSPNRPHRF